MSEQSIQILDVTTVTDKWGTRHYRFSHSYPWVRTTETVRPTIEEAFEDAREWARGYEAEDRFGNMACALGVAERKGGYVGVVNYYHSNT